MNGDDEAAGAFPFAGEGGKRDQIVGGMVEVGGRLFQQGAEEELVLEAEQGPGNNLGFDVRIVLKVRMREGTVTDIGASEEDEEAMGGIQASVGGEQFTAVRADPTELGKDPSGIEDNFHVVAIVR